MKILIILSLILSLTSFAQQKAKTEDGKVVILNSDGTWHYDTTKSVSSYLTSSIPEKREFNHPPFSDNLASPFYMEEKYDKFKDYTSVSITLKLNQLDTDLSIGAAFLYYGKIVTTPTHILLRLISNSSDWKYLRNSDLTFLVDGKPIHIGKMERRGSVGRGYILEFLTKQISIETFLEIINGSEVEGKLFTTEFKLSEEQMEALRDFASRMK